MKDILQKLLLGIIALLPSSAVAQTYPCSTDYSHLTEGTSLGNGLFILSAQSEDVKALKIFYKGSLHPCSSIPRSEAKKAASNRDDLLVFECGPYRLGAQGYETHAAFYKSFFIT